MLMMAQKFERRAAAPPPAARGHVEPKGRPPLRSCPDDFEVIFVEQGRLGCESWYRTRRTTINRWLDESGKDRLIAARSTYVKALRSRGEWITRQTRMVTHQEVRPKRSSSPVVDRRRVSFTLARHAAQHLRVIRNGGFIVSPTGQGDWWVGSRRYSAAQMVELAERKGFNVKEASVQAAADDEVQADPVTRRGDFKTRNELIWRREIIKGGETPRGGPVGKKPRGRPNLQDSDGEEVEG
jgi:hypothetical protein